MTYAIAIVGLGKIAMDQHVPSIAGSSAFSLVATVDPQRSLPDVPSFTSLASLVESGLAVDAVALCTPPAVRQPLAEQAFNAGYHVLVEKPPAATLGVAQQIADAGKKAGRTAFAAWHSRYNAPVEAARTLLAGTHVRHMKVSWREDVRHWHPGQEWIWLDGGFGVFDPGINALSIVTHILPAPVVVRSAVLEMPENRATPIAADLTFATADGTAADLSADFDWRQTGEQTWDIDITTGDGEVLRLSRGGATLDVDGVRVATSTATEYAMIYARFAQLIDAGETEMDLSPLALVEASLRDGTRKVVAPFHW